MRRLLHETCLSLCHTLRSMVYVNRVLLLEHGFKCVLPGYLNNDCLGKIFICVRSMSCRNSSLTVSSVACSEKILHLKTTMQLCRNTAGILDANLLNSFWKDTNYIETNTWVEDKKKLMGELENKIACNHMVDLNYSFKNETIPDIAGFYCKKHLN